MLTTDEIYGQPVGYDRTTERDFAPHLMRQALGEVPDRVYTWQTPSDTFEVDVHPDKVEQVLGLAHTAIAAAKERGEAGTRAEQHLARFVLWMADYHPHPNTVTLTFNDDVLEAEHAAKMEDLERRQEEARRRREADPLHDLRQVVEHLRDHVTASRQADEDVLAGRLSIDDVNERWAAYMNAAEDVRDSMRE